MNRDGENAAQRRSRPAQDGVSVGSMTNTVPAAPYTPPAITSRQLIAVLAVFDSASSDPLPDSA
jgi:hypothetical protein